MLAGHSFGGMPVRAFADLYPELTAGLVLVDASHPDQWVRWPTPHADKILRSAADFRLAGLVGPAGAQPSRGILPDCRRGRLPSYEPVRHCLDSPPPKPRRSTPGRQPRAAERGRAARRPAVAVLAVSEQPVGGELLTALQRELAELTENASFEVVQGASHESLISERARLDRREDHPGGRQAARNREESRLKRP